jgi:NADH pyrophosphatase NudC (nudix superfamily)
MKVKSYGSNQSLVEKGGCEVLYSYETPVAMIVRDGRARAYKTDEFHSVTTSKHLNQWLRKYGFDPKCESEVTPVPQEVLTNWYENEFTMSD